MSRATRCRTRERHPGRKARARDLPRPLDLRRARERRVHGGLTERAPRSGAGVEVGLQPPEPLARPGPWLVLAADPSPITEPVDELEQERVIDLSGARLVPSWIVGHLEMGDARQVGPDGARQRF